MCHVDIKWLQTSLEFHVQTVGTFAVIRFPVRNGMLFLSRKSASLEVTQKHAQPHELLKVVAEAFKITESPQQAYRRYATPEVEGQPYAVVL